MKTKAIGADDDDRLLPEREVSEKFGIGLHPLRDWRHAGAGEGPPVTRIGRRVFYRQGGVRTWLQDRERSEDRGECRDFTPSAFTVNLSRRMAPVLQFVFHDPHLASDREGTTLAVVPFPAVVLGLGPDMVDLSGYTAAVGDLARRYGCVVVAGPGHDWREIFERPPSFLPAFLFVPPRRVAVHRVDTLIRVSGPASDGGVLASGNALADELREAAEARGASFHIENDCGVWQSAGAVAGHMVDAVTAHRDGAGA